MSTVIAHADALAALLNTELLTRSALVNKSKATTNIRQLSLPAILVSPIPRRDYDRLDGGYSATWSVYCIAQGPGDYTDSKVLDEMADVVAEVIPSLTLVEPVSYVLPNTEPKPAFRCEFQTDVTP